MSLRFRWMVLASDDRALRRGAVRLHVRWIRAFFRPRPGRNSWWIPFCRPAPIYANRSSLPIPSIGTSRLSLASRMYRHSSAAVALRFLLVYTPERQNPAFVQFLVDVDDQNKIDRLIAKIQKHLDEN